MRREIHNWWSHRLQKEMPIAVYGHYGFAVLIFPTAAADFLELERFQMIHVLAPLIESGKCKVFSINTVNSESWLNSHMNPYDKGVRHQAFNEYVVEEVVPFIHDDCKGLVPIITSGASVGALHAANSFFRRPDIFSGAIAMSGIYDLRYYTKGYFDDNVYFNSPAHYLPGWNDEYMLNKMREGKIVIASGQGDYEDPGASVYLSNILNSKGINHWLDLWGQDMRHDWPTWRQMLPYFISKM